FAVDTEDEGRHQDVRSDTAACDPLWQFAGDRGAREADAAFLLEFAERGVEKVVVSGVAAPPGERPVAGPGVTLPLGAAHQQDGFVRRGRVEQGYGCFGFRHLFNYSGGRASPRICDQRALSTGVRLIGAGQLRLSGCKSVRTWLKRVYRQQHPDDNLT